MANEASGAFGYLWFQQKGTKGAVVFLVADNLLTIASVRRNLLTETTVCRQISFRSGRNDRRFAPLVIVVQKSSMAKSLNLLHLRDDRQ